MNYFLKYFSLLCLCFLFGQHAFCQVSVTGPQCVVAGTLYQYKISGNWDSLSTIQVCIAGGTIADSTASNSCTNTGAPLANVLVMWNDSSSDAGVIKVTSSVGNATLNVSFSHPLQPGSMDSLSKNQITEADSIPSSIYCDAAAGGSCNPSFSYQWQQSSDMVAWTDIGGAQSQNLAFSSSLGQTTFFRRKVTETVSGTIQYSEIATVNVTVKASSLNFRIKPIDQQIAYTDVKREFQLTLNYSNP
jgi:hypothetical protein